MRDLNMGSIRSIDRAIDILQSFSTQNPYLTIEEIAKITKIPNSTVYRILCTLEQRGLVRFDEKSLQYKPGLRLFEFSTLVSSVIDVRQAAEQLLNELHLKTGQTVLMAVMDDEHIIYVYKKEKYEGLKFSSVVGQRRPFIYGVLGPAMLAFLPDKEINRIMELPVPKHTPHTVTDKKLLLDRLQQIKTDHFYIESNETNLGVTGIGAPVFGMGREVVAAIGVVGPSIHLDNQLDQFKPLVMETSGLISAKVGYR